MPEQIKSVKESKQALQAQVSGLSSELADARRKAAQLRAALDEAHAHTARFREVIDARARRQRETERDRDRERSWLALVCMALE